MQARRLGREDALARERCTGRGLRRQGDRRAHSPVPPSQRRANNLKFLKGVYLQAEARIWPAHFSVTPCLPPSPPHPPPSPSLPPSFPASLPRWNAFQRRGNTFNVSRTFITLKPGPESGLDCLGCAILALQRHARVLEGIAKSQIPMRAVGVDFCRLLPRAVPRRANPSSSLAWQPFS
jgi:hypothetical protein